MILATMAAAAAAALQPAPCALSDLPATFERDQKVECGWISVPRMPGDARTIKLWVARIKSTSAQPKPDALLYINGGPGVATVDSVLPGLPNGKTMPVLRQDRDIWLFDQRGSGRSEEVLCPGLAKTLNDIASQGLSPAAEEERSRAAFSECRSSAGKSGFALDSYSTATTVEDIEHMRKALGIPQWNLLSISYGSLVALHAMRTHPQTIRSAILNSPYPPNSVTWAEQVSSAAAAYQAIDRACAANPKCKARFGALIPKLEATIERLEREPVRDGKALITGRQFAKALWPIAVTSSTLRFVPLAIDRAHAGDESLLKRMVATYAGGDSFGGFSPAQAYAIGCYESGRTREWYARSRTLYPGLADPAPDDSWDRRCATYRPGFAPASFFAPVASNIPALIYAGALDPATPVVDALQATRFLTRATLVEVAGAAHGPMSLDECTRGIGFGFIRDPLAVLDTSCVAKRKPLEFATDGLEEILAP